MKSMDELQELIQEAKLRIVWWILCIFSLTYFLTHTSKSMLMNVPIATLLVCGLKILLNEVEFNWKIHSSRPTSYLSYLEKKQLSLNDACVSSLKPPLDWKKKIDSPIVEAAIEEFLNKILHDFVMDLWYSDITPDKEAPELIHAVVMDAIGEVSLRIKEVNLVDLLLSDVVDLVGDHLDLFRRNLAVIGTDVMGTLSSEERDERLKQHLMGSKELHPALISPECEHKVIQQLMDGFLAVVLRPREAKCPLVRSIARELVTCLVMQPIMNFASPIYINELIEYIILMYDNGGFKDFAAQQSASADGHYSNHTVFAEHGSSQGTDISLRLSDFRGSESGESLNISYSTMHDESLHPRHADWAKACEAATLRRAEVLMPENLENMWAIGRDYKKTFQKNFAPEFQDGEVMNTESLHYPRKYLISEIHKLEPSMPIGMEVAPSKQPAPWVDQGNQSTDMDVDVLSRTIDLHTSVSQFESSSDHVLENTENQKPKEIAPQIDISYSADTGELNACSLKSSTDMISHSGILHVPKLRCRVIGASFEKLDSNSFAVYAICVIDANDTFWFVKRRYRNFEKLHRRLKDIPNYTLHLPPKRIFSSSTEDAFVHQRCIKFDKYLQDLLSIANVAEQHEVWDFLSASSKNYSAGTLSSLVTTLAVHVDNAMDDIVHQHKGVSGGLVRMASGSSHEPASSITSRNVSWNADDINKLATRRSSPNSLNSSDNDEGDKDVNHGKHEIEYSAQANGWHLENELKEGPTGIPSEWAPANLSVPILNLVDKVFQLERRGWLRRQVFWISKQILQLVMEDAIDDWLLQQIQWLCREDVIAQGIRWVQDILWPDGVFFVTLRIQGKLKGDSEANQRSSSRRVGRRFNKQGSFEQQLEAARRASDVKNMIFNGAPAPLVSLIGHNQYRRCARDIYYFLQSTVCLKQLGYGIMELVLLSLFPELRDLVRDIHEKMHVQPP